MKHQPITLSARIKQIKEMNRSEVKTELEKYIYAGLVNETFRSLSLGELKWKFVYYYHDFLQQSAQKIGLYIPCNEKGEPLEKPNGYYEIDPTDYDFETATLRDIKEAKLFKEYQEALDRIVFPNVVKRVVMDRKGNYMCHYLIGRHCIFTVYDKKFKKPINWLYDTIEQVVNVINKDNV